jgi:hypothetical protein
MDVLADAKVSVVKLQIRMMQWLGLCETHRPCPVFRLLPT